MIVRDKYGYAIASTSNRPYWSALRKIFNFSLKGTIEGHFRHKRFRKIDEVILRAYELKIIDSYAMHELDAALKYGHEMREDRDDDDKI